jgi:hypothetical protein
MSIDPSDHEASVPALRPWERRSPHRSLLYRVSGGRVEVACLRERRLKKPADGSRSRIRISSSPASASLRRSSSSSTRCAAVGEHSCGSPWVSPSTSPGRCSSTPRSTAGTTSSFSVGDQVGSVDLKWERGQTPLPANPSLTASRYIGPRLQAKTFAGRRLLRWNPTPLRIPYEADCRLEARRGRSGAGREGR